MSLSRDIEMCYRVPALYKLTSLFIYLMSSTDISTWFIACLKDIYHFLLIISQQL